MYRGDVLEIGDCPNFLALMSMFPKVLRKSHPGIGTHTTTQIWMVDLRDLNNGTDYYCGSDGSERSEWLI